MKKPGLAVLAFAAVLVALVAVVSQAQVPAPPAPRKFEYKVVRLNYDDPVVDVEKVLNQLGADGWEVAASTSQLAGTVSTTTDAKVILKRPKR